MIGALWRSFVFGVTWTALGTLAFAQSNEESAAVDAVDHEPSWSLQLAAEAGIGMRDIRLPSDNVIYQISTGIHPALGVAFALDYHRSERVSVGLRARYQSSVGLALDEQLTGGAVHTRKTRSHHFELGITPSVHWTESGWAIHGSIGYSVSELDPLNHLVTPSFHLAGPHLGMGVRVPLGSPRVCLSVGGDGQLTLQVGDELQARGISARGLGAGASAALELRVGEHWWIAATYRELHYWLGSEDGASFQDSARYLTAQLRGTL